MSRILLFPVRRAFPLRGTPVLRFVALLILLCFTVAVVWTTIISMTGSCLTPDSRVPRPEAVR